jgi:hypothetical protein
MITKEEIKKEVDRLPDSLLDQVYAFLKKIRIQKKSGGLKLSLRNFKGKLDNSDIRKAAYE